MIYTQLTAEPNRRNSKSFTLILFKIQLVSVLKEKLMCQWMKSTHRYCLTEASRGSETSFLEVAKGIRSKQTVVYALESTDLFWLNRTKLLRDGWTLRWKHGEPKTTTSRRFIQYLAFLADTSRVYEKGWVLARFSTRGNGSLAVLRDL